VIQRGLIDDLRLAQERETRELSRQTLRHDLLSAIDRRAGLHP